jgi:AmiR/NasT family two-component response regulator
VLLANERVDHMELVAEIIRSLAQQVIATEIDVSKVGALTARERPDVALVGRGESTAHALELIGQIARESTCPVIALLSGRDRGFIEAASRRGIFAYTVDSDAESLQSALDITLCRFTEYQQLQGAFGRSALIERAKGIVMERHQIGEPAAFELLRRHARESGRKLIDVSQSIVDGHTLLSAMPRADALERPTSL